jgi:predicted acetyltransferase
MSIEIRTATADDQQPLSRMLELYQHDLSDIWDQDLDAHGLYGYQTDWYFCGRETSKAFVFLVAGKYAGAALVNTHCRLKENTWWMAQFFVVKKYRGRGVGELAAQHIFDNIRGKWEVGQIKGNDQGLKFWTKVISRYTNAVYTAQHHSDEEFTGTLQYFDNTLAEVQVNQTPSVP